MSKVWWDDSGGDMLAAQAWGPEVGSQDSCEGQLGRASSSPQHWGPETGRFQRLAGQPMSQSRSTREFDSINNNSNKYRAPQRKTPDTDLWPPHIHNHTGKSTHTVYTHIQHTHLFSWLSAILENTALIIQLLMKPVSLLWVSQMETRSFAHPRTSQHMCLTM